MKKIGKYCFVLLLLVSAQIAVGQDVVFHASVDKNYVMRDDVFNLNFVLLNGRGDITPPDLSDFKVISGPTMTFSEELANGMRPITLTQYTLQVNTDCPFTIGPAKVKVGNQLYTTEPIDIYVPMWSHATCLTAEEKAWEQKLSKLSDKEFR